MEIGPSMTSEDKIIWTPDMSVGIDIIDKDNKILISCLNDFVDACESGKGVLVTESIFSTLYDYTSFHFSREEKIMEVCGYKGLENHKKLHETLRGNIIDIRDSYLLNPSRELESEIMDFLKTRLTDQILTCDMDYASVCAGKDKEIAAILE